MQKPVLSFNAMILSAGFGNRLKPLTYHIPKPLLQIKGQALVVSIGEKLIASGANKIVCNLHHKAGIIRKRIKDSGAKGMIFRVENKILGTGGGILNCKDILSENDFFVIHNGDVFCDFKIKDLISAHTKNGGIGTLLLTNAGENKIAVGADGRINAIKGFCGNFPNGQEGFTYTGIAVFNRKIFNYFPRTAHPFPLIEVFKNVIESENDFLSSLIIEKNSWNDLGTLESYFSALEKIHRQKKRLSGSFSTSGFLDLGKNCEIRNGTKLENCVLLDNAKIAPDSFHKNEIIAPRFSVHRDSSSIMNLKIMQGKDFTKIRISSVAEAGSSRKFYRISEGKKRQILMISSEDDKDFPRFIRIADYLGGLHLGPPQIYSFDMNSYSVLREDLGLQTLNSVLSTQKKHAVLYKKVIRWLVHFQNITAKSAQKKIDREFGFDGLRWESEYFKDNFLAKFAKIGDNTTVDCEKEFDFIANCALSQPQVLCHRDFQSQNIMLKDGKIRIVDFQGARTGPLCYDLMSLLRDAYVKIDEKQIESLTRYYFELLKESPIGKKINISEKDFAKFAAAAWMQRNMQMLGAFSFLSIVKGKTSYLRYIGKALFNLRKAVDCFSEQHGYDKIPVLSKIISKIATRDILTKSKKISRTP